MSSVSSANESLVSLYKASDMALLHGTVRMLKAAVTAAMLSAGAATAAGACVLPCPMESVVFLGPSLNTSGSIDQPRLYIPLDQCSAEMFVAPTLFAPEDFGGENPAPNASVPLFSRAVVWMVDIGFANSTLNATNAIAAERNDTIIFGGPGSSLDTASADNVTQDYLRIVQAFTSHADPCYASGVSWSHFYQPSSGTLGLILTPFALPAYSPEAGAVVTPPPPSGLPAANFARCLRRVIYRNLASRPCPPFPWQGYQPDSLNRSFSLCTPEAAIRDPGSFIPGPRRVYIALCNSTGSGRGSNQTGCEAGGASLTDGPSMAVAASKNAWYTAVRPGPNTTELGLPNNVTITLPALINVIGREPDNCKTRDIYYGPAQ